MEYSLEKISNPPILDMTLKDFRKVTPEGALINIVPNPKITREVVVMVSLDQGALTDYGVNAMVEFPLKATMLDVQSALEEATFTLLNRLNEAQGLELSPPTKEDTPKVKYGKTVQ
jgi:hypothetical protein